MFKFDKIEMQRIVTAAVGALVLSTACVSAAVGPARAAETTQIVSASDQTAA